MDESKIRKVTAPLTMDQIKEFFLDKSLVFIVDYANSALKGKVFLTYISNLDLPAEVDLTDTSVDEIKALVKDYMEVRNINESGGLASLVALILLNGRGVDVSNSQAPLSSEEMTQFVNENRELVDRWYAFLDSMILFSLMSVQVIDKDTNGQDFGLPAFEEAFPGIFNGYETVDDPLYVGSNVVNLFNVPMFLEQYFSVPTQMPKYFKQQFTEYMFKGKRLFHYFASENNTMFKLLMALVTNKVTVEDMVKAFQPQPQQ